MIHKKIELTYPYVLCDYLSRIVICPDYAIAAGYKVGDIVDTKLCRALEYDLHIVINEESYHFVSINDIDKVNTIPTFDGDLDIRSDDYDIIMKRIKSTNEEYIVISGANEHDEPDYVQHVQEGKIIKEKSEEEKPSMNPKPQIPILCDGELYYVGYFENYEEVT